MGLASMESGKVVRWNELLAMNMMDGGHGEWNEKYWKWVGREHYWWNRWYEKWLNGCWKIIFSSGYFSGITGLMILSLVPEQQDHSLVTISSRWIETKTVCTWRGTMAPFSLWYSTVTWVSPFLVRRAPSLIART